MLVHLSVFDLLITLKDKIIPKYSSLSELVAEFVEKTKNPIYKDFKELEIFLSKNETIKNYTTGKLVGNEVLDCKTKAFMECIDDLHKSIKESILYSLKKHNKLTPKNENYLNQAIQFSRLRKFDIHNIDKIRSNIGLLMIFEYIYNLFEFILYFSLTVIGFII